MRRSHFVAAVCAVMSMAPQLLSAQSTSDALGTPGATSLSPSLGGNGGAFTYGQNCPGAANQGSYVNSITLRADQTGRVTAINFVCSDAAATQISFRTQRADEGPQTTQTASSPKGFNQASAYAGGATGTADIVSGITFKSDDGTTVSIGTFTGFYGADTKSFNFAFDRSKLIVGLLGRSGYYFDSVTVVSR